MEGITLHYLGELKSVCAKFPAWQYDNDALYHMPITTGDITASDGAHLTVPGLRKQAPWNGTSSASPSAGRCAAFVSWRFVVRD